MESCIAYNQKKHCGCMEYKYHPQDKVVCDVFNMKTGKVTLSLVFSTALKRILQATAGNFQKLSFESTIKIYHTIILLLKWGEVRESSPFIIRGVFTISKQISNWFKY